MNVNYTTLIDILLDYKEDFNFPSKLSKNRERFEKASAVYWALDELYNYILKNGDPVEACSEFIRMASEYCHRYPKTQFLYFTAADVASDIKDILICANTKGEPITYEQNF